MDVKTRAIGEIWRSHGEWKVQSVNGVITRPTKAEIMEVVTSGVVNPRVVAEGDVTVLPEAKMIMIHIDKKPAVLEQVKTNPEPIKVMSLVSWIERHFGPIPKRAAARELPRLDGELPGSKPIGPRMIVSKLKYRRGV